VETIEEGMKSQSPAAAEFWKILGGTASYQCTYPEIKKIPFMCHYLNSNE